MWFCVCNYYRNKWEDIHPSHYNEIQNQFQAILEATHGSFNLASILTLEPISDVGSQTSLHPVKLRLAMANSSLSPPTVEPNTDAKCSRMCVWLCLVMQRQKLILN